MSQPDHRRLCEEKDFLNAGYGLILFGQGEEGNTILLVIVYFGDTGCFDIVCICLCTVRIIVLGEIVVKVYPFLR